MELGVETCGLTLTAGQSRATWARHQPRTAAQARVALILLVVTDQLTGMLGAARSLLTLLVAAQRNPRALRAAHEQRADRA